MKLYGIRRTGTFYLSWTMLELWPDLVRGLLARCVVLRCEYHLDSNALQYTAWSEEFAEVPELERAPEYGISLDLGTQRIWFVPMGQETMACAVREDEVGQAGLR